MDKKTTPYSSSGAGVSYGSILQNYLKHAESLKEKARAALISHLDRKYCSLKYSLVEREAELENLLFELANSNGDYDYGRSLTTNLTDFIDDINMEIHHIRDFSRVMEGNISMAEKDMLIELTGGGKSRYVFSKDEKSAKESSLKKDHSSIVFDSTNEDKAFNEADSEA